MGLRTVIKRWLSKALGLRNTVLKMERERLSKIIDIKTQSTVAYGIFEGMTMPKGQCRSLASRGSMLLGLYERDVQERLHKYARSCSCFVDIGAADGYYAVGMLYSGLMHKTYCYEILESCRKSILKTAQLNKVDNSIEIFGEASSMIYEDLSDADRKKPLFLVDIEGGEFGLLNSHFFNQFSQGIFVIEVHDFLVRNGGDKYQELKVVANETHKIEEFLIGARDLSKIKETYALSDDERWLLCSEGRPQNMKYLCLTPK